MNTAVCLQCGANASAYNPRCPRCAAPLPLESELRAERPLESELRAERPLESELRAEPPKAAAARAEVASPRSDDFGVLGARIGRYRIEAPLGGGGMGMVYRARVEGEAAVVALKLLSPALVSNTEARARFAREARALRSLDHVNVGAIIDVGEQAGQPYIVLALYEGEDLRLRLLRGPLPVDEALAVLEQVLAGLGAAHARSIVHRDLKPSNVMMTLDGTVKLVDFGLAKVAVTGLGSPLTQDGTVLGTAAYASPEQMRGEAVDGLADLWAVGVLSHEIVTGTNPFQDKTLLTTARRIFQHTPARLETLCRVPPAFSELVARLLEKEARARVQTAAEAAAVMAQARLEWAALAPASKI